MNDNRHPLKNRTFLEISDLLLRLAQLATAGMAGYFFAVQDLTDPGWLNRSHWEITTYDVAGTGLLILIALDLLLGRFIWEERGGR